MRSRVPHDTMASKEALLKWCSQICISYPQVEITNLSTSFRDGLAFCAIIHKHRPDLIDFKSLSRANIYENNQLAFEVAETKLGIPAFLIPKEMLAIEVPDYLSVITYLSQYYHYFSRPSNAGSSSLRSTHIKSSNKRSTSMPGSEEHHYSDRSLHSVCHFCIKPVHLIQRNVIHGEIWHRSCFRCQVCHGTLAAGFYTPGKDAGGFICCDHITTGGAAFQTEEKFKLWEDCLHLSGLTLINIPKYSEKTKSHDKLVYKPQEIEQTAQHESSDWQRRMSKPPSPVQRCIEETSDGKDESPSVQAGNGKNEVTNTEELLEFSSPCVQVTGESKQLASEQTPISVPAPLAQASQSVSVTSGSSTVQSQSSHFSSNTRQRSPIKTNHPWLGIIHPGPWTQLPPVQSPGPPVHSKRGPNGQVYWYRPKVPPPNPFSEDLEEEDAVKTELQLKDTHIRDTNQPKCSDLGGVKRSNKFQPVTSNVPKTVNNIPLLTRSLSAPAVKSKKIHFDMTGDKKLHSSTLSEGCKEKEHFDAKTEMTKSKTCQALTSGRAPAPGHGFPLIKRKVQEDQYASAAELQEEMKQLKEQLEAMEEKGVELERNLRECNNDEEEERLLTEWLALTHERQILMRQDTELVYLTKQKTLEERQADVEYELRRLLNKPENIWSEEDRGHEQSLMAELLVIIEQRNQIVSILDQDRKRERQEDVLSEGMMTSHELQKEGLKEFKKSKGKFKPSKVFKKRNQKGERTNDSVD
ncbi:MICAL-like protein 1 isoform X2 [Corythoichthys intestinalis]|uniref:MICAL-like protein 1 isoform X2 n=1 Tax=Corythoichthys intestinalis TaxID=161448 RepID=UPI0025A64F10|nr:MICAL-like protein 1 isoform X2 [Corythoichthys intestinalis]